MKSFIKLICYLLAIFIMFCVIASFDSTETVETNQNEGNHIGFIVKDCTYEQTFTATEDNLCSVEMLLATFARTNHSTLTLELHDSDRRTIALEKINAASLMDNSYYKFDFEPITDSKGKTFSYQIYSDADESNAVTSWASANDNYLDGELLINDEDIGFDLAFNLAYEHSFNKPIHIFFIIVSIVASAAFVIFSSMDKVSTKIRMICWSVFSVAFAFFASSAYSFSFLCRHILTSGTTGIGNDLFLFITFLFLSLPITSFAFFNIDTIIGVVGLDRERINHVSKWSVFILLGVLCGIFAISTFSVSAQRDIQSVSYSYVDLNAIKVVGYAKTDNYYQPVSDERYLELPVIEEKINSVTVFLKNAESPSIQMYWSADGLEYFPAEKPYLEGNNGFTELTVFLDKAAYSGIRLVIDGNFELAYVREGISNLNYSNHINFRPSKLIIAIFLAVIIFLLNMKLHWDTFFRNLVIRQKEKLDSLNSNRGKYIYHVFFLAFRCFYFISAVVMLYFYSKIAIKILFILTIICCIMWIIDIIWVVKDNNPAKLFLVTSLPVIWFMSYSFPLSSNITWDDQIHYTEEINLLNKMTFSDKVCSGDYYMMNMVHTYADDISEIFMDVANNGDETIVMDSNSSGFVSNMPLNLVAYLPAAFISFLRRVSGMQFYLSVIFSRFINGLVYSFVLSRGIRHLKSGGLLLSAISLMPTCLFIASNFTYDYWVTAFCGYSIAYLIGILQTQDRIITNKDMICMFCSMIIGCGPKAIYFILLFCFLFVKKEKFQSLKSYHLYLVLCCISIFILAASFILPNFVGSTGTLSDYRGGENINGREQIIFILHNPLEYAKVLLLFLLDYFSIANTMISCGAFAYLGGTVPNVVLSIILVTLAYATFSDNNKSNIYQGHVIMKLSIFASTIMALCLIATVFYISFTAVGSNTIGGVQWRYCIPLLFPFLHSIGSLSGINNPNKSVQSGIIYISMLIASIITIYHHYIQKF